MANSRNSQSIDLLTQAVGDCLRRFYKPGQHCAVAFSGGIDSTVLLHALVSCGRQWGVSEISAVHIDHGLNAMSGQWAEHCAAICDQWKIRLQTCSVSVPESSIEGPEAAARRVRYAALHRVAADWMLLGHHRDDQAETLLLNLLRGAGVMGAAGMPEARGRYLRPLLTVPRHCIDAYARHHGLTWIHDNSNDDLRFSRNYLRNSVLPELKQRFPAAASNLSRSAKGFFEMAGLLADLAVLDKGAEGPLPVSRLRTLTTARALNLLAYELRRYGARIPSRDRLEEMLRQLLEANPSSEMQFALGAWEVRRYRDRLHVIPTLSRPPKPVLWRGQESILWCDAEIRITRAAGVGLGEWHLTNAFVTFACREGGEKMRLYPGGPRRPLKDLLREAGIPPWNRNRLPVMFCAGEPVWVPGIGIAAEYRCGPEETGISLEFDARNW